MILLIIGFITFNIMNNQNLYNHADIILIPKNIYFNDDSNIFHL